MRDHEKEGGVRGFHGPRPLGGVKVSFPSDTEARVEFERIVSTLGLRWITDRIMLRASAETPDAEAGMSKTGERFIFYNAVFMQKVTQRTAEHWSLVSILAHEVGHHLALHVETEGRYHEFELEADYFSGFVLRRLGATLDQAQVAMRLISPKEPSLTHPGLDQRLQVIAIGWIDAGASGAPRGLKDATQSLRQQEQEAKRKGESESAQLDPALPIKPGSGKSFRDCAAVCPEMVVVPPGSFMMGSPPDEAGRGSEEGPQRKVVIAQPFAVGKYEVTFAEWDACVANGGCRYEPHDGISGQVSWGRGQRPVINVSWHDITLEYLPWLSRKTGRTYRLLTEAEWEYVARAGTATRYHFGDDSYNLCAYGNVADQTLNQKHKNWTITHCRDRHVYTAPVGSFRPNAFGLHDMHGNVWEWVQDCWNPNHNDAPSDSSARMAGDCGLTVLRGGSWYCSPRYLRSAFRGADLPISRGGSYGFRVARTLAL